MPRTLAFTVTVARGDTTEPETFPAGTSPPKWAADKITNRSAWAADDTAGSAGEGERETQPARTRTRAARSRRSPGSGTETEGG